MLNAGRKYLGAESLAGRVFVTSGLGGMSGAQAKVSQNLILFWGQDLTLCSGIQKSRESMNHSK